MPRSASQDRPHQSAPSVARITRTERKRQLVEFAAQAFTERGYHNTTLELVAEVAGVSETRFVKYFEDKPALFRAVLVAVRTRTIERWRAETAALPDPLAKLHAIAERFLGGARSDGAEVRLLFRTLAECDSDELAVPLGAFFVDCELFLAGILAEGQQAGVFRRSLDPRVGAWQLLHAGLGRAATQPLRLALQGETDALSREVDSLLQGLLKTDV